MNEYKVKRDALLLEYLINDLHFKRNVAKNLLKLTLINGKRISQFNHQLHYGDTLVISDGKIETERKDIEIIYEDDDLIAINKPAGLLSIATEKDKDRTAYHLVMEYLKSKDKHNRVFIIHRIDKETSGVLVFAKNEETKILLQDNWNDIVSHRDYYALVEGKMENEKGHIENYLKENKIGIIYVTGNVHDKEAKKAVTDYKVIRSSDYYSLLDVSIKTGRKNQIRATFASLEHTIIGDHKYNSTNNQIKRLGLHAYRLTFRHPVTGKEYDFITKMPGVFNTVFRGK